MSNAIIKQGANSRVADNVWEFHLPEDLDLEPLLRWFERFQAAQESGNPAAPGRSGPLKSVPGLMASLQSLPGLVGAKKSSADLSGRLPNLPGLIGQKKSPPDLSGRLQSLLPKGKSSRPALPIAAGLAVGLGVVGALVLIARRRRDVEAIPRADTPWDWPINFAHRGGAGIAPENTIEGFRIGLEAGGGVIETDVHTTADGHVVVIHDADTVRTTGESVRVAEATLAQLQELNAAATFRHADTNEPWSGPPLRIPTLAEVYRTFPDRKVNIEIKGEREETAAALWQVIQECGAQDRTLVVGTKADTMKRFREVSGGTIPTGASTSEIVKFWLRHLLHLPQPRVPYQALQVPKRFKILPVVNERFTQVAHEAGLRVDVWTIDDPDEMHEVLDARVDGVMTDRPDLLAKVLAERA